MFSLGEIQYRNLESDVCSGVVAPDKLVAMGGGRVGIRRGRKVVPVMNAKHPRKVIAMLREAANRGLIDA